MKLLIVEDNCALNNEIALSLSADRTFQAYTAAEARGLLREDLDLVILDINLPDGSGLEERLRETE